jgi:hypothetical protein
VVVPAAADGWSGGKRSSVLLHELAHVERHDVLTQFVAGCDFAGIGASIKTVRATSYVSLQAPYDVQE